MLTRLNCGDHFTIYKNIISLYHISLCLILCDPMDCRWAPQAMRFSWQDYWRGLPFPPPRDLPYPGIELMCPASASGFFTTEPPGNPYRKLI